MLLCSCVCLQLRGRRRTDRRLLRKQLRPERGRQQLLAATALRRKQLQQSDASNQAFSFKLPYKEQVFARAWHTLVQKNADTYGDAIICKSLK